MTDAKAIRACGWTGLCTSLLLAMATVWAFASYRTTFGAISKPLHETVLSAEAVLDQITATTKTKGNAPDDAIASLRAAREQVKVLKAATEKQRSFLPLYATNAKDAASSLYEFAGAATVVANGLSVALPTGVQLNGALPTIVWGRPLEASAQSLRSFGQRGARLGVSLDAMATTLNGDAGTIAASAETLGTSALALIDDLESLATAVKVEHLPQLLLALEHLKETLRQVDAQAGMVDQLGIALVSIGMLLALGGGALSFGMIRVANALEGDKT